MALVGVIGTGPCLREIQRLDSMTELHLIDYDGFYPMRNISASYINNDSIKERIPILFMSRLQPVDSLMSEEAAIKALTRLTGCRSAEMYRLYDDTASVNVIRQFDSIVVANRLFYSMYFMPNYPISFMEGYGYAVDSGSVRGKPMYVITRSH